MANTTETVNLCGLKREDFQATINGKKTDLYILRNRKGYEVAISNYGGAICAIMVPETSLTSLPSSVVGVTASAKDSLY